jgi:hypothetical protein
MFFFRGAVAPTLRWLLFSGVVLAAACGGKTLSSDDTTDDSGTFGRQPDGSTDGNTYVDPQCPDAGSPQTVIECDIFGPNTCGPGEACYPASIPPRHPCESEIYGAFCLGVGSGTQGSSCDNTLGCAPGYVCLITGTSTQCAELCELGGGGTHGCAEGYVCEPIDVPGFSACL